MKPHRPLISQDSFDSWLLVLTTLAPAIVAAVGVIGAPDAAHDDGVVRTVGAGFTGLFHALDLLLAAPFLLLPFGTRALRAGLASAVVAGAAGALAFTTARSVTQAVVPVALKKLGIARGMDRAGMRLASAVSAASVLAALVGPVFQTEASAPGGAVVGACLVLAALHLALLGETVLLAFVLGLAVTEGPFVLLAAIVASVAFPRGRSDRTRTTQATIAFTLGLLPLVVGALLAHRAPELSDPAASLLAPATRPVALGSGVLFAFATTTIGRPVLVLSGVGAALSFLADRRLVGAIIGLVVTAGIAMQLKQPAGPDAFAAPVLVGVLAVHVFAGVAFGVLVLAIARARVPFAEWSAALVVVLELVLPLGALDQTSTERAARVPSASSIWNDIAWGSAPPASVVLVADRATMRRIATTRAVGELRADLVFVPQYDVLGRAGQNALLEEPKLAPLYRDIVLGLPPEELSLAELGAQRAVLATFDPTWERALSRHLVPLGLSGRFEAEPRGTSDRKKALDGLASAKARLVTITKKDPALAAATSVLLRARAVGMAATGERDMLSQSLDDLRAFAPDDPTGAMLVRRLVTTKGAIDVHDLGGPS